jgi:hypothetical protein
VLVLIRPPGAFSWRGSLMRIMMAQKNPRAQRSLRLSRFAPRAGLVSLRQIFERRCHKGGFPQANSPVSKQGGGTFTKATCPIDRLQRNYSGGPCRCARSSPPMIRHRSCVSPCRAGPLQREIWGSRALQQRPLVRKLANGSECRLPYQFRVIAPIIDFIDTNCHTIRVERQ